MPFGCNNADAVLLNSYILLSQAGPDSGKISLRREAKSDIQMGINFPLFNQIIKS